MVNQYFLNNGFFIIRNAFSMKLLKEIQSITNKCIFNIKKKGSPRFNNYKEFCSNLKKTNNNFFLINTNLQKSLIYNRIYQKIFTSKKFYKNITNILGKDLAYCEEPSILINLSKKFINKNYYFKDWHQEIWSGADLATLQFWTPLFQKNNNFGQIQLIPDSHKWGHIPHSNRKPLSLPKKFKTFEAKLNLGDIIFFSTTLMHRSSETLAPRLALPGQVRNFRYSNRSFEYSRNWKIFSYSEITKIERALGNHYLSPYRLLDKDQISNFDQGTIAK